MQYNELHLHTGYSLLDGLNNPDEYMVRAKELDMTHLAVTDHGLTVSHRPFQKAAKEAGIIPILGIEMYISELGRSDRTAVKKREDTVQAYNHIIVLARNENGLKNLNKLSEIAFTEGFYSKPRIDMEVLEEHNEDLIVLSGCINGLISKAIINNQPLKAGNYASEFKRIFGDRFFIEVQGHNPKDLNLGLMDIAKKYGVKPVVTSDCHYARKEDLYMTDIMLILSTKPNKAKHFDFSKAQKMDMMDRLNYLYPERKMTFQEYEIYLRSAVEQKKMLKAQGIGTEPIENTNIVASMIGDYPYHDGLDLLPEVSKDPDKTLRDLSEKGAAARGTLGRKEYDERREEELKVYSDKGFATYILIESEIVQWGKEQGIRFGPGRGSGAGSLVLYEIGVTDVDPIEHGLLFFRFVNPDRIGFPDIDTDIEDRRRSELKAHILQKYKNVASVATFGTFGGKQAVRSAASALGVPLADVNKALKGADWPKQMDWFRMFEATEKGKEFIRKYPEEMKIAKFLQGRFRTQGMHAGGIVISKSPVSDHAPIQTAIDASDPSSKRIPLIGYDKDTAEEIGFIKYDFLGLKALSVISETLAMVKDRTGKDIELLELDYADPAVYRNISDGYTQGIFQAEGHTFTHWLLQTGASKFNDLVIGTSIARPGPLTTVGENYKRRLRGEEAITYAHPVMEKHTSETLGLIVYQEQVMLAMTDLAGMSMSTADKVRKIIGKKRDVSEFEQYKEEFVKGASEKVSVEVAERLWSDFEAHAGYSFNKSHAVAYSMVTYWTAWLKEKYPIEFMTAALRNENDKDKSLDYLLECKRLGIRVMLPHVNKSDINFTIESDEQSEFIRFGLSNIKFVSEKPAARLIAERPFKSYAELVKRVMEPNNGLTANVLKGMNAVGASVFEDNPRTGSERENLFEYLNIPAFETGVVEPRVRDKFVRLVDYDETETFVCMAMVRAIKTGENWARVEMVDETGSAAAFTTENNWIEPGYLYIFLIAENSIARYMKVRDFISGDGGDFADFLHEEELKDIPDSMYRVIAFNTKKTKKGDRMATVVLSNNKKEMTKALVWPSSFMKCYPRMSVGSAVDVQLGQTTEGTIYVENIL